MLKSAIALVFVLVLARLVLTGSLDAKSAHSQALSYAQLPPHYLFVLFPRKDCETIRVKGATCPQRAMLVAKEEYDSGTVQFSEGQDAGRMINTAALDFAPSDDVQAMLHNWYRVLPEVSDYSGAQWTKTVMPSGTAQIRLTLEDGAHARKEQFLYVVDANGKVTGARTRAVIGVFELVALTVLALGAAGILWHAIATWRKSR